MMYDDVALTKKQLREYYCRNEHYAVSNLGGSGSLSDDNRNRYNRIIDNLHPGTEGIILDIGCGQGGFVAQCLQRGLRAAGIEPSEKSRLTGHAAGIDIYASIAEYVAKHPKTTISTIVISHVLEHLLEPLEMLKELIRKAPRALIYIEVPDAASYIVPNGYLRRILMQMNLREAFHFCGLRSAPNAHFGVRTVAQQIGELIRSVHPTIGKYLPVNPHETKAEIENDYFI
jgi:SAM-dependent methyltransferase